MVQAATADVVVRSRQKGAKVYDDLQSRLDGLNAKVKRFGILAGAAAVGGIAALTAKSFASADALAKHADRIGTSTTKLAALRHLTELTGGSSDNLDKSLQKANKALGEFNLTGSGTAAPFLKKLNLDTQALAQLRPDELFNVYADAIRGLDNRSEQAAASAALFGDRTGEMLNLIDAGADALVSAEEEVDKYGIALNRVDSAKIEAANDALFEVGQRATGIGNVIASKVAPFVTALANRFLDTGAEANVMGDIIDKVLFGIATGVGLVADAIFGWKLLFQVVKIAALEFVALVVGEFARIERAVLIIQNKMAEAFGGEKIDIRGGFLTRVEDSLKASSEHAQGVLAELAASEKPSEGVARAFEKIREDAQLAAQATANTRAQLQQITVPDVVETDADGKAREKEAQAQQKLDEQAARKLESVEASLRTETERLVFALNQRQEIVDSALERGLITKDRALEIERELLVKHEAALNKITLKGLTDRQKFEAKSGKDKAKQIFGDLANITAGVATHNKVLFRINQVAGIANAIINTAEGITEALSQGRLGKAAVIAAAGAVQIATISSTQIGAGSTPSSIGSVPTLNDQPLTPFDSGSGGGADAVAPRAQIQIIVEGSLVGDEGIRTLLTTTIGELIDADELIIDPNSRQAEEIRQGSGSGG